MSQDESLYERERVGQSWYDSDLWIHLHVISDMLPFMAPQLLVSVRKRVENEMISSIGCTWTKK